ncbi:uracil-DNA glycosylase [Hutsoniella sourekii]
MFDLEASWQDHLADYLESTNWSVLEQTIGLEYQTQTVFPPQDEVFRALNLMPFDQVRVVILGQDPYHGQGQANGMAFSVHPGIQIPPSLRNIYQELESDLNIPAPNHGDLSDWAKQGVLLLNTVLTVRAHEANSHRGLGWEELTDLVIQRLNQREEPVIFVLWGRPARQKAKLINQDRHYVIQAPHPSPLSAYRGFFGSKPFSKINEKLAEWQQEPIDWQIKDKG